MKILFLVAELTIVLLLSATITTANAQEADKVDLALFYGQGCPHCSNVYIFLACSGVLSVKSLFLAMSMLRFVN